jgi:hypothetical protein
MDRDDGNKPTYSQTEVNEIIRRALDKQAAQQDHLDHEDLVAIASEVGIDRASLERAKAEIAKDRDRAVAVDDEAKAVAAERAVQLKSFAGALFSHAVMNAGFFFIDTQFFGGTWFKWPLLGSAILLTFRLRRVLAPREQLLRRQRKDERRRARHQRRAAWIEFKQKIVPEGSGKPDKKQFEIAVQAGVTALIKIAARKLDEHAQKDQSKK